MIIRDAPTASPASRCSCCAARCRRVRRRHVRVPRRRSSSRRRGCRARRTALAAIRECFEEAGILLAHDAGTVEHVADGHPALAHDEAASTTATVDLLRAVRAARLEPAIESWRGSATGSPRRAKAPVGSTPASISRRPRRSRRRRTTTTRPSPACGSRPGGAAASGRWRTDDDAADDHQPEFLSQFDDCRGGDGDGAGAAATAVDPAEVARRTPTARSSASSLPDEPDYDSMD